MRLDAVLKDLFDLIDSLVLGHLQIGLKLGLKVALCLDNAVTEPHEVTRQQALDVLEEGHRLGHILEGQIRVQRLIVEALGEVRMLQNTLDLGGVAQIVADDRKVQGLDAEEVAREENRLGFLIIDREREHAAQMLEHILAPLLKSVEQHFAVRGSRELVSRALELLFQLLIIIYFAVIGEYQITVLVADRLIAVFEVDDGQSAEAHRDVVIHIHAVRIGTAVGDDLGHLFDDVFSLFQLTRKAANTAHIAKLLSKILAILVHQY